MANFYTGLFYRSLVDAGFFIGSSYPYRIDKPRAAAFFSVSVRTLERWLLTDKPCPRASSMLALNARAFVGDFVGFTIGRDGLLWHEDFRQGKSANDLRMLEHHMVNNARLTREIGLLQNKLNAALNKNMFYQKKSMLLHLSNELAKLANSPHFEPL